MAPLFGKTGEELRIAEQALKEEYDALIAEAERTEGRSPVTERGLCCLLERQAKLNATLPRLMRFDKTPIVQQMRPVAGGLYRDHSADSGAGAHTHAIHVVAEVTDKNNHVQEMCIGPLNFNPYYVAGGDSFKGMLYNPKPNRDPDNPINEGEEKRPTLDMSMLFLNPAARGQGFLLARLLNWLVGSDPCIPEGSCAALRKDAMESGFGEEIVQNLQDNFTALVFCVITMEYETCIATKRTSCSWLPVRPAPGRSDPLYPIVCDNMGKTFCDSQQGKVLLENCWGFVQALQQQIANGNAGGIPARFKLKPTDKQSVQVEFLSLCLVLNYSLTVLTRRKSNISCSAVGQDGRPQGPMPKLLSIAYGRLEGYNWHMYPRTGVTSEPGSTTARCIDPAALRDMLEGAARDLCTSSNVELATMGLDLFGTSDPATLTAEIIERGLLEGGGFSGVPYVRTYMATPLFSGLKNAEPMCKLNEPNAAQIYSEKLDRFFQINYGCSLDKEDLECNQKMVFSLANQTSFLYKNDNLSERSVPPFNVWKFVGDNEQLACPFASWKSVHQDMARYSPYVFDKPAIDGSFHDSTTHGPQEKRKGWTFNPLLMRVTTPVSFNPCKETLCVTPRVFQYGSGPNHVGYVMNRNPNGLLEMILHGGSVRGQSVTAGSLTPHMGQKKAIPLTGFALKRANAEAANRAEKRKREEEGSDSGHNSA